MENYTVPDLKAAARHLDSAHTSLADAVKALGSHGNHAKATILTAIGKGLGEMVGHFREGRLAGGLSVSLIDVKVGAGLLGRSRSAKKLEALAKAREVLAKKRQHSA